MILHQVLARAHDCNVKTNLSYVSLVKYFGTIVSDEGIKPDPANVSANVN